MPLGAAFPLCHAAFASLYVRVFGSVSVPRSVRSGCSASRERSRGEIQKTDAVDDLGVSLSYLFYKVFSRPSGGEIKVSKYTHTSHK